MMEKKLIKKGMFVSFLFVFIFLSLSFVSAVPPVSEAFDIQPDGLQIQMASLPYYQVGTGGAGMIHIFNNSNGASFSSTTDPSVSCDAHILDINGSLLFDQVAVPVEDHFVVTFNSTDITQSGLYSYTVHCNSTEGYGAYITGYFEASGSGVDGNFNATAIILILIVLAYILIGVGIYGEEFVPIVFGAFILFGTSLYTYQNGLGTFANDNLPVLMFTLINVGIACYVSFKGIYEFLLNK